MLTNIENRLEELFEQIEMMPSDKVEAAEKVGGTCDCVPHVWLYMYSKQTILNPALYV